MQNSRSLKEAFDFILDPSAFSIISRLPATMYGLWLDINQLAVTEQKLSNYPLKYNHRNVNDLVTTVHFASLLERKRNQWKQMIGYLVDGHCLTLGRILRSLQNDRTSLNRPVEDGWVGIARDSTYSRDRLDWCGLKRRKQESPSKGIERERGKQNNTRKNQHRNQKKIIDTEH